MKVPRRSLTIFCALLLCLAPCLEPRELSNAGSLTRPASAAARTVSVEQTDEETVREAEKLLALSEKQNHHNHALALQTAQRSLALWQTTSDNAGIARAYSRIGQYYYAQSDFPEAVRNYEQALQLWRNLNDPVGQADNLIMLGFIDARKGEWSSAISFYTQAERLIEDRQDLTLMARIAAGLADVFYESGMPENSLIQYGRALDYYRRIKNERGEMRMLLLLGNTYYLSEKYPEALNHLEQALASFEPDSLDAAQCHEYLGKVRSAMREYDVALPHLQTALAGYIKAVNPNEAARVRALMGHVYQQQGQRERARQLYRQALEVFIKSSDQINQAAVYYALGQLSLEDGSYDAAEGYLSRSIEVTENMRRVSAGSDLTAAFSASVYERYEKYIECLMRKREAQPAQELAVRAFEASELARARSLAELLRATETNLLPGLDPQLAEKEKSLRQALRVKEDRKVMLLSKADRKEELAALTAELERLKAEFEQVGEIIRARYPAYEQITRPVAWNLQRIQEQVIYDEQTVLLEYSLGEARSYVWAVTRHGITPYELPAQASVKEAAAKVYKLMSTLPGAENENEFATATQELSRMVLSPVAAELNKQRIIVVADGALNYIPFQVLPAPAAPHEPLVANYEVINTPSASILGELQREAARRQPAAKMLAAFGDPVFASNYELRKDPNGKEQLAALPTVETERLGQALRDIEIIGDSFDPEAIQPLRYARRELANIRDVVAGEISVAREFAASREELLKTDLTQYAILHFATHGLLDSKRPEISGLMLSTVRPDGQPQNGFVALQDIYQLRAPVNLVVLSACQTALGQEVRGEGLIGLTRGFMYAGASTVVASLWEVDDGATADLMKRFYANMLERDMTPASALRAAQNSFRQEGRSPYYWAAFTLQGEFRQSIKPMPKSAAPTYTKIIAGGALLTLLAGVVWWYRRRRMPRADGYSTSKI